MFSVSRMLSLLNRVPMCSTCQCSLHTNVAACPQIKSVPTSHFSLQMYQKTRSVPNGVPMFQCSNVRKSVLIFQTFLLRNAKGNFCYLLLYKNSTLYLIS